MIQKEPAKILAVDDEENFLQLLSHTLEKDGYAVKTAMNGQEAMKRVEQEQFDLALLDVRMAPMDGLAVLGDIKRRSPHTKVIMITAYPSPESRSLSLQKGAEGFLVKPIEIQELKQTIRAMLSHLDIDPAKD
jgi:CheY-like chemotaxis protein